MLISNIINDSFGLLSKQLRFYCWHFRRNLDQRQRQELIELLHEQHFERLASKIKSLNQSNLADCKQQIGRLLFEHCLKQNRRNQLVQLIESKLVDINVRLDNYGNTLLHRSAYNLDVELVKLLIEHEANLKLRDQWGNTALHIAILSYRNGAVIYGDGPDVVRNLTSIIKLLLEADKNLQNERCKRFKLQLGDIGKTSRVGQPTASGDRKRLRNMCQEETDQNLNNIAVKPPHQRISGSVFTDKPPAQIYNLKYVDKARKDQFNNYSRIYLKDQDYSKQTITQNSEATEDTISLTTSDDVSIPLVDTKNAFGRTPLHCCVNVVGEHHLAHFVQLLISFGADTDATNTRMETPLYCLVKRPGISAVRQKYLAITHLLNSGCDDLGLSMSPNSSFPEKLIKSLEENISNILQSRSDSSVDPIFANSTYKRVPSLKHMARLNLKKNNQNQERRKCQAKLTLPRSSPASLNLYVNRKILDQSELN